MNRTQIQFRPEKKKSLIVGNKEFCSANLFELTEEEKKKAEIELHETEEKKKKCLQELRRRIANDGINCRTDDDYLLRYLRVRKYDCDKAYHNIKESDVFKRKYPQYFSIGSNLDSLLNANFINYLPYTDEEGNIIILVDVGKWDSQERSFEEEFQVGTAVFDIITENPKCQVNGIIGIYDCKGVNRHHVTSMLANNGVTKYTFLLQNLYPWRVTKGFYVNSGSVIRTIYRLVRPLISKKIADRVNFLGSDMSELHQYINPALLPKTLGGMLDEEQYSCTQNVLDNIPFLKYNRSQLD